MARTIASTMDKYELYQESVQDAVHETRMFMRIFKDAYKRPARLLREDFCGAALVSAEWTRRGPQHEAWGVDLDNEPLKWGREHNIKPLTADQQTRVHLVTDDVRSTKATPRADVVAAQNFSFYIFKKRDELKEYFTAAHRNLLDEGVLILDMIGGPLTQQDERRERRRFPGFTYIWDQVRFDPIENNARFYIHFRFKDGSNLDRAFTYDWRMWTIPEVREALLEVGFSDARVYWAEFDWGHEPVYRRRKHADADATWLAYVVGVK